MIDLNPIVSDIISASGNNCLDFFVMLKFCLRLNIFVVHQITGYECYGGPKLFLSWTTVSVERWYIVQFFFYCVTFSGGCFSGFTAEPNPI